MSANDLLTRLTADLPDILSDISLPREPDYTDELIAKFAVTPQRPRWWFVGRSVAGRTMLRRPAWLPTVPWRLVAVGLLVLAALAAVAIFVGSSRRLPPPFGIARPGAIAYVANGEVWRSNLDGSGAAQVTSNSRIDLHPIFSPDGTKLAITRLSAPGSHPNWEEWGSVIVTDEHGRNAVVIDDDHEGISPVTWSSDGRFLVYSKLVDGRDQVVVASSDGSSTRLITSGPQSNWGPVLASDDRRIAFAKGYTSVLGVYVIDVDGSHERPLAQRLMPHFDLAAWSPDGRTLVYAAGNQPAGTVAIWAIDLATGAERQVVRRPGNQLGPAWSPDGERIAYLEELSADRYWVVVVKADGAGPHKITDVGSWTYPQWTPDARHVVAADTRPNGGEPVLAILDPDGREPATIRALPDVPGFGRADLSTVQRLAP
jgi:Tol biopolymer transport system component